MGNWIVYILFRGWIGLIRIMPFRLIYIVSDFVYLILYYIAGYRKAVVIRNLKKCFPEKTEKEIKLLQKKFYKNLSDLFLETFKGFTLSKREFLKRFKAYNSEVSDKFFDQGRDVIVLLGHFANWEWAVATLFESLKHQPAVFYKPISNKYIDRYFKKVRGRFGIELVSVRETRDYFMKKKPKPVAYYMIADQFPPITEKQKLVDFFSSKTPFLHGPEKYATQLDIPVVYLELQRVKRGYYKFRLIDISANPASLAENELTQLYAGLLEESIKKQPENWVWSHKRWKRELY